MRAIRRKHVLAEPGRSSRDDAARDRSERRTRRYE
jgi:hypothetical protein